MSRSSKSYSGSNSRGRSSSRSQSRSRSGSSESASYFSPHHGNGKRSLYPGQWDNDARSYVVFVRNLAPECKDEELREAFSDCGEVISASVIHDLRTGRSKSFGFVSFSTTEAQTRAVNEKNGKPLLGKHLVVQKSTRKTTIYVGNLPEDYDEREDEDSLKKAIEQHCGKPLTGIRSKGRYAFIEFLNFEHTQCALHKLPGMRFKGSEIRVQLANSKPTTNEDGDTPTKVDGTKDPSGRYNNLKLTLFVRNIDRNVTESDLRKEFEKHGKITRCEIIRDKYGHQREFGFVAFKEREHAEQAFEKLHNKKFGARLITVEFAKDKPPSKERLQSRNRRRSRSRSWDRRDNKTKKERQGYDFREREYDRRPKRDEPRVSRVPPAPQHISSPFKRTEIPALTKKTEIDDVLAQGVPVMVFDASAGRYVLLTPGDDYSRQRRTSFERERRRDRSRDRWSSSESRSGSN